MFQRVYVQIRGQMTTLYRTRVNWTGFPGAPGVSTFYSLVEGAMQGSIRTLFASIGGLIPADVTLNVEYSGDAFNDVNGDLVGSWSEAAMDPVVGTGTGVYSAPSGLAIDWLTETIVDSHHLRGRTYIVPLIGSAYEDDGSIASATLTALVDPLNVFVGAVTGAMVVWHRPREARDADATHRAVTARAGSHGLVTTSSVPDKAVILRSRRD